MAQHSVKIRRNSDETWTVRIGRNVEHFSADKSKGQLFDVLKWSVKSKGVNISDVTLIELINEANKR